MQVGRSEKRSATAVAVMLTSVDLTDPSLATEFTTTENISGRGARVVTKKLWSSLVIKSLEGDLQSEARVIYCQPIRENVYAIGLQLIAPRGDWKTKPP